MINAVKKFLCCFGGKVTSCMPHSVTYHLLLHSHWTFGCSIVQRYVGSGISVINLYKKKKKNPVRLKTMFQLSSPSTIWPKFAFLFIFLLLIPSGPCSRQEIYNSWLKGWYIILYFSLLDLQLHLSSILYSGNQESYNMLVLWWNVLTLLFIYIFTTIFSHELLYVCFSIAFQFLEFFHLLFSWQKISTLH